MQVPNAVHRSRSLVCPAHPLVSLAVDDSTVLKGLDLYEQHHRDQFVGWKIQILSKGKTLTLDAEPTRQQHGNVETLTFSVTPKSAYTPGADAT